ncbi:MAG: gliding motility-associated C-terminal domain-containing protein, partial [Salibacteraceae bacterium]
YSVRLTDACDTVRTANVQVDVSKVEAAFDWDYISDYELQLTNKSVGNSELKGFIWDIEKANIQSFEESPIIPLPDGDPYIVMLTAIDEYGCEDVDTAIVRPSFYLYIPNAFSPNSDGKNDVWGIKSRGINDMRLEIYDRWGNSLFYTDDKNFEWDGRFNGKRLPMGVYTWRLILRTDENNEEIEKRGAVTLLNDFSPINDP